MAKNSDMQNKSTNGTTNESGMKNTSSQNSTKNASQNKSSNKASNASGSGVQHFLLPKNFLKPYFRLIILSNFPYFYVVCAVCI